MIVSAGLNDKTVTVPGGWRAGGSGIESNLLPMRKTTPRLARCADTGLRLLQADQDPVGGLRAMGGLNKVEQVGYLDVSETKTAWTLPTATSLLELRETPIRAATGCPLGRERLPKPPTQVDTTLRHLVHYVLSPFDNAQWEVRMPVWNGPLAPMRIHGTQIR